ncbi:protein Vhl-like [Oppia nitens]|uniref:protein Vhl-like n=1 Tax=Oppia nitens TaxID=1686743 RepID=UPI0023DCAD9B|nr:protein Vhl-like [Oppia nitens]
MNSNVGHKCEIQSTDSSNKYLLIFVNFSLNNVDVLWIDYSGVEKKYITLNSKQQFRINTYLTHPWIFRDSLTKHRLCFDIKYLPLNSNENKTEDSKSNLIYVANDMPRHRVAVLYISQPFYTLRELCFQSMRQKIGSKEDVNSLEIPKVCRN